MDMSSLLRSVRTQAGLSLRDLAARSGTSHSTLAAYEHGRIDPSSATVNRIIAAAGFALDLDVARRHRGTPQLPKGAELVAVLDLASEFPASHSPVLTFPVFGR